MCGLYAALGLGSNTSIDGIVQQPFFSINELIIAANLCLLRSDKLFIFK